MIRGGDQVVNLFDRDLLPFQLFPERIKTLDPALDGNERDLVFGQSCADGFADLFEGRFQFGTSGVDIFGKPLVFVRVKVLKRKVLKLASHLTHPEAVGDGCVNIERFLRYPLPLFRL